MVGHASSGSLQVLGGKGGSAIGTFASVVGLVVSLIERSPTVPGRSVSGVDALTTIIVVALLAALLYGLLWSAAERLFGWKYGAGSGKTTPHGWAAIVLSLSMTLSLAFAPVLYQNYSGIKVVLPMHWRAMVLVVVLGACAHVFMYGTRSSPPNGFRQRYAPTPRYKSDVIALKLEAVYAAVFFACIVLPYRMVVTPGAPVTDFVLLRTLLPALVFFFVMMLFVAFKPEVLKPQTETRGIIAALVMMFCFCTGMFL
ncbi:MAG: hypothetical protein LAN64_10920 [Acidobacteriia bacterium]|nr:hypothetical protein [Terriglobia bacterium]